MIEKKYKQNKAFACLVLRWAFFVSVVKDYFTTEIANMLTK